MRHTLLLLLLLCGTALSSLGKGSVISGRVTSADGKPIAGAPIHLTRKESHMAPRYLWTGGDGTYSFNGLDSGEYQILFSSNNCEAKCFTGIYISRQPQKFILNVQLQKAGNWGNSIATRRYKAETIAPKSPKRPIPYRSKGLTRRLETGAFHSAMLSGAGAAAAPEVYAYAAPPPPAVAPKAAKTAATHDKVAAKHASYSASPSIAMTSHEHAATDVVEALAASSSLVVSAAEPAAGRLTSGEVNDFSKWKLWEDVSMEALKGYRKAWPFRPEARYTVVVKSRNGMPLANARVKMSDGKGQIWEAMTDNTGKAELWHGMWATDAQSAPRLSASVEYGKERFSISGLKPFSEGTNILSTNLSCLNTGKLDIAFLVDATGSMGDEISYLKAELRDILKRVKDSMPGMEVQTGALFYRDTEDDYLTRISDLTPDFNRTESFIADNEAGGGGDTPEGVDAALEEGLNAFSWRAEATARLAFLVLDAPPHGDAATVQRMQELTARYAARGIRLIPVVCSGADKATEYLMRAMALATNGTYLFLTDHSGIGGRHIAPTTDHYDVEYLNGLIYRVIYQCAYMPSCKDAPVQGRDTSSVQQRTDSVTTLSWRYFPNPTMGIIHISHTNTSGYLLITDVTGKAIMRVPASPSGTTTIDLTQYPAGIYAIRYNWAEDKWVSGKFVLTH